MKIWLTRHGQTRLNKARLMQGRTDEPLNERGIQQARQMRRILLSALCILGFGMCLSFVIIPLFSQSIVRTEVENMEKQKQFITNASHELKTPLAVIKANTELQEIMDGETEWSQ